MLGRYNETSRCKIDVFNGNMRTGLTWLCAVRCFAPVNGLAAQRKIRKAIHIELTDAAIFRVGAAAGSGGGAGEADAEVVNLG